MYFRNLINTNIIKIERQFCFYILYGRPCKHCWFTLRYVCENGSIWKHHLRVIWIRYWYRQLIIAANVDYRFLFVDTVTYTWESCRNHNTEVWIFFKGLHLNYYYNLYEYSDTIFNIWYSMKYDHKNK